MRFTIALSSLVSKGKLYAHDYLILFDDFDAQIIRIGTFPRRNNPRLLQHTLLVLADKLSD